MRRQSSGEYIVRRHRLAIAVLAAGCVLITACQPLHLTTPEGSGKIRYRDAIFTEVEKTADLTYGKAARLSGSIQTLKLDLYQPKGDTVTKRPAIVWVHGGGFKNGNKESGELVDQANVFSKATSTSPSAIGCREAARRSPASASRASRWRTTTPKLRSGSCEPTRAPTRST